EVQSYFSKMKEDTGCQRCSENDPVCLDYHHMNKDKTFIIAEGIRKGLPILSILIEIEKCILLCANCHRKEHARLNFNSNS
ncbi:MAG: hypothetical protein AAB875_07085, partial [Patescibacteria group bacterium]